MSLTFGNVKVTDYATLSDTQAKEQFTYDYDFQSGKYYTVVMMDDTIGMLHYLTVNLDGGSDALDRDEVVPYTAPAPPDSTHSYTLTFFLQPDFISEIERVNRSNFNLKRFINIHGLKKLDSITFDVTPPSKVYSSSSGRSQGHGHRRTITRVVDEDIPEDESKTAEQELVIDEKPRRRAHQNVAVEDDRDEKKRVSKREVNHHRDLISYNSDISEQQAKYCGCVVEVAAKQPGKCDLEKAWFQKRDGQVCYNPYAICAKSTGTSMRGCWKEYDFDNFSTDELEAFMNLDRIYYPPNSSHGDLLKIINKWRKEKL